MYSNLVGGLIDMLKVQEIREIIKLIDESSINEFTYETNGTTVIIKKPSENENTVVQKTIVESNPQPSVENTPVVTEQPIEVKQETPQPTEESQATEVDYDHEIISPMVGTFYQAPSPESDPYVKVGSKVNDETVVCIVEAMKLFNEIEAEVAGEITEILVEDGELVEYGQPLFRVKTT